MTFSKVDLLENCISIRWLMASLNSLAKKKKKLGFISLSSLRRNRRAVGFEIRI